MGRHQLARRPNGSVKTPYFALKGGLNLVDAPLAIKEGMVLGAVNYELLTRDGYRRIDGFERFDGQPSPSSASYWILNFDNKSAESLVDGACLVGETSGAKGKALNDEIIDGVKTNLLLWSEEFNNAAWVNAWGGTKVITANAAVAPDGTTTADKLTSASGGSYVAQAVTLTSGVTYTFSFWAARVTGGTETTTTKAYIDSDLIAGGSLAVERWDLESDGSYTRYSLSFTPTSTGTWYVGIGGALVGESGVYIWGAQLEELPSVADYVKSMAVPVSSIYGHYVLSCVQGSFIDNENLLILGLGDGFGSGFSNGFG